MDVNPKSIGDGKAADDKAIEAGEYASTKGTELEIVDDEQNLVNLHVACLEKSCSLLDDIL